jgi:hypothetical protein
MSDDAPLFAPEHRHTHGRVRKGLDADVKKADVGDLSSAGVAALRSLADQIDQLERQLRSPYAKPYDRVPLGGLVREFRETYEQTFATLDQSEDPLTRALAEFTARDRNGIPAAGNPEGPDPTH